MTTVTEPSPRRTSTFDFDLHGVVRVRLLDATPRDHSTVLRQLGPLGTAPSGEPDITVRFVDHLPDDPLTYVGVGDCGFNRHGFFVLRKTGNGLARALVAFDAIGSGPVITCERSMPAVPHLIALINLTALHKSVLPLHASAYTLDDAGVLVTGWAKGGKTESLLAAMGQGGRYVGDEWVYVTRDLQMLGLPEPIRLWAWQLQQLPELSAGRAPRERRRLRRWRHATQTLDAWSAARAPGADTARRAAVTAARQAYVQVPPAELFGPDKLALRAPVDAVVLVLSHSAPEISMRRASPTEVSARMRASLADERAPLMAHYRQFRFAFPDRHSEVVEGAAEQEARLLDALFADRPASVVSHPHPCSIVALGDAVQCAALSQMRPPAERTVSAS